MRARQPSGTNRQGEGEGEPSKFEARPPDQKAAHDDLDQTKSAKKEARKASFVGGFGLGGYGLGTGPSALAADDVFGGSDGGYDLWSSDDSGPSGNVHGLARTKASGGAGTSGTRSGCGNAGLVSLGMVTTVNLVADFRPMGKPAEIDMEHASGEAAASGGSAGGNREAGNGKAHSANDAATANAANAAAHTCGTSSNSGPTMAQLPEGLELDGGEPVLELQPDGSHALLMPEGGFLRAALPASPWALAEDGRLHSYSIVICLRLEALPIGAPLPLFNGGAVPSKGERIDHVYVYKNGGVGALGDMGAAEAALRAERWSWVVVTRRPGELRTYVDGRPCAVVKIETPKSSNRKGDIEGGAKGGTKVRRARDADVKRDGGGGDNDGNAEEKKSALLEKLVLDPQCVAIFAPEEEEEVSSAAAARREATLRGLAVQYLRITNKVWSPQEVCDELHKLRSHDDEADLQEEAELFRMEQLSLQPIYAKPPPAWLHPAVAAEFGDPFIGGTALENGEMHVSLEVITLALDRMLKAQGRAAAAEAIPANGATTPMNSSTTAPSAPLLSHATRSALNNINAKLKDARRLAQKLAHVRNGAGQERVYFSAVAQAFDDLRPSETLLLPYDNTGEPLFFAVRRGDAPDGHHLCTFALINAGRSGCSLYHKGVAGPPPKLHYHTALELGDIPLARLRDDAWWTFLWYASSLPPDSNRRYRRGPLALLYEVLLPFLAGDTLDSAIAKWEGTVRERGLEPLPARTLRRSKSTHYGAPRHAIAYLLFRAGVSRAEARVASLLLRLQLFEFIEHDLSFVAQLEDAERSLISLACRRLAYKASKLGSSGGLRLPQLQHVQLKITGLTSLLQSRHARTMAALAPPPLALSVADAHLLRPPLADLLGEVLYPPTGIAGTPAQILEGAEVVGLYFGASWCPACASTTPMLATAYLSLRSRGKRLEVVHVPQDRTEAEHDSYRATMPWPAMGWEAMSQASILASFFGVSTLPSLVLLDASGVLISTDGVRLLRRHAHAFPWGTVAPPETPHLFPLFDRLLRLSPVDTGPSYDLPTYKALDFLAQPTSACNLSECVAVLRECDLLCTTIAVQGHCVLNIDFLKVALVQHTFTALLPMPKPEGPNVAALLSPEDCPWRTPMLYDQQLGILLLLQRIMEHFAASVFSLDHTRSLDAVRITVAACIVVVADVVMRQIATDKPSRVCLHLRGTGGAATLHGSPGFTIGASTLARQGASVPCHTPELNTARTEALDYFAAQESLPKIYQWDKSIQLESPTTQWIRRIAADLSFPADTTNIAMYVADPQHLVSKNFPEFRCYRDIAFYFKLFLNPQRAAFPTKAPYTQRQAELRFLYFEGSFFVCGFDVGGGPHLLMAKPQVKLGEPMPEHRFPSLASASFYTTPTEIYGEDDVLHMWDLPDFGELDVSATKALGQHDSELLLSFLTVPYLRIPLVLAFFASDDRIHALQVPKLQCLLDAVLFEPGAHLPLASTGLEPMDVPSSAPELLGTAHHLLLNELIHSPSTVIESVLKLARQAVDLDTGTLKASTTTVILYVVRLCARFDNYASFLLDCHTSAHDSIGFKSFRGITLPKESRKALQGARQELRSVTWGDLRPLLLGWYHRLSHELEVDPDEEVLDENVRHMCNIHAHLVLMLRNIKPHELNEVSATTILAGMAYLATRHQWNKGLLDVWDGAPSFDAWRIPETEIYEVLHVLRRKLVLWLRETATQHEMDGVLNAVLRVSEGTGALLPSDSEAPQKWAYLEGTVNRGRYVVHSSRTRGASAFPDERVETLVKEPEGSMVVDAQVVQLTWMASHPQALKHSVAGMDDVVDRFGDVAMQACLTESSAHRDVYQLVGRSHSIAHWTVDKKMASLEFWRAYYPHELFPSEKAWLPSVFEPIRRQYMLYPQPLQLFLPEEPLPEDAQVAYLVGKQPRQAGVWLEIFVYRVRRVVHVYRLESHGRRHYRSLTYTSDARFTLREMQPPTDHRHRPWPSWARHEAGHPYAVPRPAPSAVITREPSVSANLSFGVETYLPARLLFGIIPQALLDKFIFWQDEDDHLRGYPDEALEPDSDDMILVNLGQGGHVALHGAHFSHVRRAETSLTPARALILRLKRSRLERQRRAVDDLLAIFDDFMKARGMLSNAFTPTSHLSASGAHLLRTMGGHAFGKNTSERVALDLERVRQALTRVDLAPFERRRKRHRVSAVVAPALLDAVADVIASDGRESNHENAVGGHVQSDSSLASVAAQKHAQVGALSAGDLEEEELILLDLLHAPDGSYLHSLANVMTRVENLSHVLAWARHDDAMDSLASPDSITQSDLRIVSLPRLKLTFQALPVGESVRLYSIDHADLYITNERNEVANLLDGIPHSLLLSNSNGEMSVLVPAWPPVRPRIDAVPFSTELVLDRADSIWAHALEHPYYIYPVHVSLSFLYSTTLASALYLVLLRYLNRQYSSVVQLIDTVGTDASLTKEESNILQFTTCQRNAPDEHPDAIACRLRLSLVMMYAPLTLPWDVSIEMGSYLYRLEHVSADCRLSDDEELALLRECICDAADRRFDPQRHSLFDVTLCKNRRAALRARATHVSDGSRSVAAIANGATVSNRAELQVGLTPTCSVELPPRKADARWIHAWHSAALEPLDVSRPQLEALLEEVQMRFKLERAHYLEAMLTMINELNDLETSVRFSIAKGGFLTLYCLFQGTTRCRPGLIGSSWGSSCSQTFATLLLTFLEHQLKEPSLLNSILLCMARVPELGPLLPEFVDDRIIRRRDLFCGVPTSEEPNTPLALLLRSVLTEIHAVGGVPTARLPSNAPLTRQAARARAEILRVMQRRRVDNLTKERVWGGGGLFGRRGMGGGAISVWGGNLDLPVAGGGLGAAGGFGVGTGVEHVAASHTGGGRAVSFGGFSGGEGGFGGGGFYGGGCDLEHLTKVTEEQVEREMQHLEVLSDLRVSVCDDGFLLRTLSGAANDALTSLHQQTFDSILLPLSEGASAPPASNHSCAEREMRPREPCPLISFRGERAPLNTACPVTLCDFEEGEMVRRLPRGHMLSEQAFEQLVAAARKDHKLAVCPFTRADIEPGTGVEELLQFCDTPLDALGLDEYVEQISRRDLAQELASAKLGFDISNHPDAHSKVALDMSARLEADVAFHASEFNGGSVARCRFVRDASLLVVDANARAKARKQIRKLLDALTAQRDADAAFVREALPLLLKRINTLPPSLVSYSAAAAHTRSRGKAPLGAYDASTPSVEAVWRSIFELRRSASLEACTSLLHIFCLLISSRGETDILVLNPFLSLAGARETLDLVVAAILRTTRVGQINRCAHEARGLMSLLVRDDVDDTAGDEAASAIALKAEALAEQLLTRRHYTQRLEGVGDHCDEDGHNKPLALYDPRFLLFEFTHNIVLRAAQVELVHEFVASVRANSPLVKQMLMGGGKTTVVGPLLALMLGDGETLVIQTMPQALLEQSKATLRATFSSIMRKRVFTLVFDRCSELTWQTVEKLHSARATRGVVLCTASTIKSLQLKALEKMDLLRDSRRRQHPSMEVDLRTLVAGLSIFRTSCLIMDEVDMLLHPLKSELNFPIGDKHALDLAPERWLCAIHACDAVFYHERRSMSVPFHQSARAHSILNALAKVVDGGYTAHTLQRSPHLTLLNEEWYHSCMKPIMAQWMLLWLEANHVSGLPTKHILTYVSKDYAALTDEPWTDEVIDAAMRATREVGRPAPSPGSPAYASACLHASINSKIAAHHLNPKAMQLLNLCEEWLSTFLPHCLQKVDRVSFGLLSTHEVQRLARDEPHMPRSRLKLAIPFLGKDVPSTASEFAHPDIIIGLTVLAYRYEGLRRTDFEQDVMALLRSNFEAETGPYRLRKSALMYNAWVEAAGGRIKGTGAASCTVAPAGNIQQRRVPNDSAEADDLVVPLWLLKQSNDEQVARLYQLLHKLPAAVHWYLEQTVFPTYTQHQHIKLSASGQELGGSMLFDQRLGFSGTPSDLLPIDLGACGYELGSDGRMMHVLTSESVMSVDYVESGWTVSSLLARVATAEPRFHALIDTGALVTGLGNEGVARELLASGLGRWCEGVVFLDESDEKVILVRATGRVLKLSQCGIAVENRFAFYDQIHTTGMDIKHALNARAALTLGKDMVWRDLAQGAFRMRGIANGQTITMLIIPEVNELMKRQLAKASGETSTHVHAVQHLLNVEHNFAANEAHVPHLASGPGELHGQRGTRSLQDLDDYPKAANGKIDGRPDSTMSRQVASTCISSHTTQRQQLLDVAAWLTLNSMRTERIMFDQLCGQNLATLWRQCAWDRLIEGHVQFKVHPECVQGYILESLGAAFASHRLGKLSREALEGKALAIYFEGSEEDDTLVRALQQAHKQFGCEEGHGPFEIIYVTSAGSLDEFIVRFRSMPWLALPFSHGLRREKLRQLFEVLPITAPEKPEVVLLNSDGSVITRDGKTLMKLAYACQSAINEREQEGDLKRELKKIVDREQTNLSELNIKLERGPVAALRTAFSRFQRQLVAVEVADYLAEPVVPQAQAKGLADAARSFATARQKIGELSDTALEALRAETSPTASLRMAIETVCAIYGFKPDWKAAQMRLMPTATAFRERLMGFEKERVPHSASQRLRRFAQAQHTWDGFDGSEALVGVAEALRTWLLALLACEEAQADVEMSIETTLCTPAMAAACEAICDLYGLHDVEDDLRGTLLMADKFPPTDRAASRRVDRRSRESNKKETDQEATAYLHGSSTAGDGSAYEREYNGVDKNVEEEDAGEEEEEGEEACDGEVAKLQEQASTLGKLLTMMETGVKEAAAALPRLLREIAGEDFNFKTDGVPDMLDTVMGGDTHAFGGEPGRSALLALCRAVFLLTKPSVVQGDGASDAQSVCREMRFQWGGCISKLQSRLHDARSAADGAVVAATAIEGVTETEWVQARSIVSAVDPRQIPSYARMLKELVTAFHRWLEKVLNHHDKAAELASKRAAAAQAKEQQARVHTALDAAGNDSPFSLTLMAAVSRATAEATGERLRRGPLLWALNRAKGVERGAVALAIAQPRARVAVQVLRDPLKLRDFDASKVTAPMARKARETLRAEGVRALIDTLDAFDEARKAKKGNGEDSDSDFDVSKLGAVMKCSVHSCPLRFVGTGERMYCDEGREGCVGEQEGATYYCQDCDFDICAHCFEVATSDEGGDEDGEEESERGSMSDEEQGSDGSCGEEASDSDSSKEGESPEERAKTGSPEERAKTNSEEEDCDEMSSFKKGACEGADTHLAKQGDSAVIGCEVNPGEANIRNQEEKATSSVSNFTSETVPVDTEAGGADSTSRTHGRRCAERSKVGRGIDKDSDEPTPQLLWPTPEGLSPTEASLLRWVRAALDLVEARAQVEPYRLRLKERKRQLAQLNREAERTVRDKHAAALAGAVDIGVSADLFPPGAPWSLFPWYEHLGPRSECEEALRVAIGLREADGLEVQLKRAAERGLTRKNSLVFYEAVELKELLRAHGAATSEGASALASAHAASHAAASGGCGADPLPDSNERTRVARHMECEINAPATTPPTTMTSASTTDVHDLTSLSTVAHISPQAQLNEALSAFLEPIDTTVLAHPPVGQPLVRILQARADEWSRLIMPGRDTARRDTILSMVTDAVGLSSMQTEQSKEQEQEKEAEAEQEREVEMERYIDMAYVRDNEEPRRWAFCELGQRVVDMETIGRCSLAPIHSGAFYPASEFRLNGSYNLPFPADLLVSRNHFNLDWTGERRLKNATMVLEWLPSAAESRTVGAFPPPLDDSQASRLDDAIALLDIDGSGQLSRHALREAMRAAEDVNLSDDELDALALELTESQSIASTVMGECNSVGEGGHRAGGVAVRTCRDSPYPVPLDALRRLLISGRYRSTDHGRYFVLLSLAEAETIRALLHMRRGCDEIVEGSDTALALRCVLGASGGRVLDSSTNWQAPPDYQRRVAISCYRFLDSAMHFKLDEMRLLLRSLPAPCATRRLFFTLVMGCRRRLRKAWENTPLARLFILTDDWSLLRQRAQAVRVRHAIRRRGLLLHDAFQLFDYMRSGSLALEDVYGALTWLGLPVLSPNAVLDFVRAATRANRLSYRDFMELLGATEEEEADFAVQEVEQVGAPTAADAASANSLPGDAAVTSAATSVPILRREASRVQPRGKDEMEAAAAARATTEELEEAQVQSSLRAYEVSRAAATLAQSVGSNFSWLRNTRRPGRPAVITTRHAVYYDCTRAVEGTDAVSGLPNGLEARGRAIFVRQGYARIPCIRASLGGFFVARVPFARNGGGDHLNCYTLTLVIKLTGEVPEHVASTAGWDSWSKLQDGDADSVLQMQVAAVKSGGVGGFTGEEATLGAYESFGEAGAPRLALNEWCVLSASVSTSDGVMRTYIDGKPCAVVKSAQLSKDGPHAIQRRLALFWCGRDGAASNANHTLYLRSACVHTIALDAEQVRREHAMLHELLIEDAIESTPSIMRPSLAAQGEELRMRTSERGLPEHSGVGYCTTNAVRRTLCDIVARSLQKAAFLREAVMAGEIERAKSVVEKMEAHELEVAARWRLRDGEGLLARLDEATPPYGETLAHACAFAGALATLRALLSTRAHTDVVRRRGVTSGFTALHSAVAANRLEAARTLLEAGAKTSIASTGRRLPLWTACAKAHREMAMLLFEYGADPYATTAGAESPMDVLRRMGGDTRKALQAELAAAAVSRGAVGAGGYTSESDDDSDGCNHVAAADDPDEVLAARTLLACGDADAGVMVPSLHPHPLFRCSRNRSCEARRAMCITSPTTFECSDCAYVVCTACFEGAPREGAAAGRGAEGSDALAELLFRLACEASSTGVVAAEDDGESKGDAGPDDTGGEMNDEEDEADALLTRFESAKRADAGWSKGLRRRQDDDESDEGDEESDVGYG